MRKPEQQPPKSCRHGNGRIHPPPRGCPQRPQPRSPPMPLTTAAAATTRTKRERGPDGSWNSRPTASVTATAAAANLPTPLTTAASATTPSTQER